MNFEQLRSFSEVARTGHFTRAAERLHLAQPSLSRQIAVLESELGVELFHRARGNVALTAAGERLLPIARRMLADAQSARAEMAELTSLRGGRVRLGATPTLCTTLVADVLAEFVELYPGIDIEIFERGSRSLISALVEGSLDLALIVTSVSSGSARAVLELEPILSERLVVVSAADAPDPFVGAVHGFEGQECVSCRGGVLCELASLGLEGLASVPQIVFPENYDLRVGMDAAFRVAGVTARVAVEGVEMETALRFAERGIGVAVVPAMVAGARPGLRVTPLAPPDLMRTVSVARRSDMAPTHASVAMVSHIRSCADRLAADAGAFVSRL